MSAYKPKVFVIGASGKCGAATVASLSSKYRDTAEIYAGTRDLDKAGHLKLPGVNLVRAEMGKKEELLELFKGIDSLFIVTPSYSVEGQFDLCKVTADAAKEAGVKFILLASVVNAEVKDSALGSAYREIEDYLKETGVSYCSIRLPSFMEESAQYAHSIKNESMIRSPVILDKKFRRISTVDIGKASAEILVNFTSHENAVYKLVGDCYNMDDLVQAISEVLGKEIKYYQMSTDELRQMFSRMGGSEKFLSLVMELIQFVNGGHPTILDGTIDTFKSITGDDPITLKEWVVKNSAIFK